MYQNGSERQTPAALPRRPRLGIDAMAVSDGRDAVRVASLAPASPAERAGVRVGDEIVRLAGEEIRGAAQLARRVRALHAGESVAIVLERDGARVDLAMLPEPLPLERFDGAETRLGQVTVRGHRLRTIAVVPRAAAPLPAIFYLAGLGGGSCESPLDPHAPLRRMVDAWTRAGFVTMRVERSGVGDSEGPPPAETDLATEVDGYRAAREALAAMPDVREVWLFGHSVGGMIAPLLARERPAAGVAVAGTSSLPWHECIARAAVRQNARRAAGGEPPASAERLAGWTELHTLVCTGALTPRDALERRPDLRPFASSMTGETVFGHHASFFHQLERADLAGAWRAIDAPVLVLRGEHDETCSDEEGRAIAGIVDGVRAGRARYRELGGLGHDLDEALAVESAAWIRDQTSA